MQKNIYHLFLFVLIFPLIACTGHVDIPPVTAATPEGIGKISGKYIAIIQTGGWRLNTKTNGLRCGIWSFDTTLDNAWLETMRSALSMSLERVDFTNNEISREELLKDGYEAQIIVYQGNATSNFDVNQKFFIVTGISSVELTANIAITDNEGLFKQYTVSGKSTNSADIFLCSDISETVAKAGQEAVRDTAQKSIMLIRDGLRERKDKGKK